MLRGTRSRRRLVQVLIGGLLAVTGCDDQSADVDASSVYTATIEVTNDPGLLGSLVLDVKYLGFDGEFATNGEETRCEILAGGAFGVITRRSSRHLRVGLASFSSIATPGPLLRCQLRCLAPLGAEEIQIVLREALDPSGDTPSILPSIAVTLGSAPGTTTTTSAESTTSTTTLDAPR